ncbi:MAG: prolyl aminopeptidase [Candidatus Diapherotrites archaeon]
MKAGKQMTAKNLPYRKGYVKVSDGHRLYFELLGNPCGRPVLFLHGGPGAGFSKKDRKFFNKKKLKVIFFDQRGAGKSKPFASLKGNTTFKLVEDIKKLLTYLNIDKVFLFGGSWGSTLALLFAIKYPEKVTGMLLRGIFLASSKDINYIFNGPVKDIFPEARERFLDLVPKKYKKNYVKYYFNQMKSPVHKIREKFAFEWTYYENSILQLKTTNTKIKRKLRRWNYRACALVEAYYTLNNFFLKENYILKNVNRISHIKTVIIHGRYDMVCSPLSAYLLHKKIKNSKLYFVTAGHYSGEKEIKSKIISEMKKV